MKTMKNIFITISLLIISSTTLIASSLDGKLIVSSNPQALKEKLRNIESCGEGYTLAGKQVAKTYDFGGEATMAAGFVATLGGIIILGSPAGLLVAPIGFVYNEIRSGQEYSYYAARDVFSVSQRCDEDCNDESIDKIRKWLAKKDIEVTNYEIAQVVNNGAVDLSLCTSKITSSGVRKLKSYKELRKSIKEIFEIKAI